MVGDVAEVGFFNTSSVLFSRALIKDSEGNPTTLTLLADEQLFITYEFRKYPTIGISYPLSLKTNLEYEDYTYTVYPAKINTTSSSEYWYSTNSMAPGGVCYWYESDEFVDETNIPSGTASAGTAAVSSYTSGSFTHTISCVAGPLS